MVEGVAGTWSGLGSFGPTGHFLGQAALTLSLKWFWLGSSLQVVWAKFGTGVGRGQDREHRFPCTAGEKEGRRKLETPFPLGQSCSESTMAWSLVFLGVIILLSEFPGPSVGGPMPRLADRKLCADEECSHPISMAVALQDYVAPDCRFLTIHRGQVVYVYSKLKGRGRLFWGGSVQGDYYGDLAARLGYFPSSIVREESILKPGKIDVKTDKWDFYCQ
ncbi:melanoma-derived growth regulatory protein isoform X2 [Diceros bicornis minor]|uniref:melanoma-derived growth regulatory protein isoform X2 n=1 Tax=Diceros bicornis minor TaxID=77932 RepID=UPI0026EE16CD|nr:melanoma-derived growth regulatory protein isoform X2 [Diceros bicornis minor]